VFVAAAEQIGGLVRDRRSCRPMTQPHVHSSDDSAESKTVRRVWTRDSRRRL